MRLWPSGGERGKSALPRAPWARKNSRRPTEPGPAKNRQCPQKQNRNRKYPTRHRAAPDRALCLRSVSKTIQTERLRNQARCRGLRLGEKSSQRRRVGVALRLLAFVGRNRRASAPSAKPPSFAAAKSARPSPARLRPCLDRLAFAPAFDAAVFLPVAAVWGGFGGFNSFSGLVVFTRIDVRRAFAARQWLERRCDAPSG